MARFENLSLSQYAYFQVQVHQASDKPGDSDEVD